MRTSPYAVVLLDEFEKAHPDVHKLFLPVFDDGRLTDAQGRTVDFSETVIILTSNVGPASRAEPPRARMGFVEQEGAPDPPGDLLAEALARAFPPELRNRIQKVVAFKPLSRETAARVLEKVVGRVNQALGEKGLALELTPGAASSSSTAAERGVRGPRLERAFRELVEVPLSRLLLEGGAAAGGRLRVVVEGEGLGFEREARRELRPSSLALASPGRAGPGASARLAGARAFRGATGRYGPAKRVTPGPTCGACISARSGSPASTFRTAVSTTRTSTSPT